MSPKQVLQVNDAKAVELACQFASSPNVESLKAAQAERLWETSRRVQGLPRRRMGDWGLGIRGPAAAVEAKRQELWRRDRDTLTAMQERARSVLDRASADEPLTVRMTGDIIVEGKQLRFEGVDPVASFEMTLAWLLIERGLADRVRKCPECGRFFLRVRRQKYCQDACTDRANWREYPEAKKQQSRAKQYAENGWSVGARKNAGSK